VGEKRAACVAMPQKVQQKGKLACSTRKEIQEVQRKLRKVEKGEAAYIAKP